MIFTKRFIITAVVGVTMVSMMGITAFATSLFQSNGRTATLPGVDAWNRGIQAGSGTGYYMAYSYYYNPTYTHASEASLPGSTRISTVTAPGATSTINSLSEPSYAGGADFATANGRYAEDQGNGEFSVSGWLPAQ